MDKLLILAGIAAWWFLKGQNALPAMYVNSPYRAQIAYLLASVPETTASIPPGNLFYGWRGFANGWLISPDGQEVVDLKTGGAVPLTQLTG